ncbi:hypothetical protein MHZ92_14390 [Sporosarcina sp. ACRSL]|uniref:hypothetical protein n=1 Tax=Sporosarcina sp. ACRSL TaxID=2918215 RepID=UPI001EF72AE0|nr:hypothetical protein [Sporosarcina sp. ACRSL]MCG7345325.1 hypothetical protein [Sporosarcina sp. ACRSL]
MAADKDARGLTVKIDVDVAEALTGLKAVQREAKKAAQALREVEAAERGDLVAIEDAKKRLTDVYKMPEAIATDCVASRNKADMSAVLTFLDRYGSMLTMPRQRYGRRDIE